MLHLITTTVLALTSSELLTSFAPQDLPATQKTTSESIRLPTDWSSGTRYGLEFKRSTEVLRGDEIVGAKETITRIAVEVRAKNVTGSILRWTWGHTKLVRGPGVGDAYSEAVANALEGMTIEMDTDELGRPEDILELDKLKEWAQDHVDAVRHQMHVQFDSSSPKRDQEIEDAFAITRETLFGGDFEGNMLEDISALYVPLGARLRKGDAITYGDSRPNPFGGIPLPMTATIELAAVRLDRHEAEIAVHSALDADKASKVLLASLRRLAQQAHQPAPDQLPPNALHEVSEEARYVYDTESGLPISMEHKRTTFGTTNKRTETRSYLVGGVVFK